MHLAVDERGVLLAVDEDVIAVRQPRLLDEHRREGIEANAHLTEHDP